MADKDNQDEIPDQSAAGGASPRTVQASSGFIPASPPQFVSLDQMMSASNIVNNMMLAHEIALDEDFRIEKPEPAEGSIEKQVADTMKRAFWDSLSEKLSAQPPDFRHALVLIEEVKEKLLGCLLQNQQQKIKAKIDEVLDMELIKQKIENDAFDISYYAVFVQHMMSQLCAPARDEEVKKLKEITDVVPLFKEIFRILDVMHLDMANYTIQQMRPYLKEQSVNYERKKFEEFILQQEAAGVDGLEFTREWLDRSHEAIDEHEAGQTMLYTSLTDISLTPANVLHGAILELLNWTNNIFPETCLMDQQRFLDIAQNLRKLTLVSSTLIVASNSSMSGALTGHTQLRDRLKAEVLAILLDVSETQYRTKMVNVSEHVAETVNKELSNTGYTPLNPEQMTKYKEDIAAVIDPDHPVRSLLWKRIMTFIWQSLSHSSSQPMQLPQGLGAVSKEITQYCGKFLKLASHNKAVFGVWYADIVSTAMHVTDLSPRLPPQQ